jgi:hypothetical protein
MKKIATITNVILVSGLFAIASCSMQEEKTAKPAMPAAPAPAAKAEAKAAPAEKAPAKAKVEKARGDIGLLDTEKNYLILVTKEGKLLTLDFDSKTKATQVAPTPGKISDIGLGSSATVTYEKGKDKNVATAIEYRPAKGGD